MTERPRATGCPDAERLAEYVEGRLSGRDREAIEAHLADCDACREVVTEAVRLGPGEVPASTTAKVRPVVVVGNFGRRRALAAGGGVLALAASLILVVQVKPELNPFRRPTPYEELVAAVGTRRSVEGRLTGFPHGPYESPTRSDAPAAEKDFRLLAALARVQEAASENPNAENLRSLGVANLAAGRYDEAISALEKGAAGPESARAMSDLAAAYIERGRHTGNTQDYARSLTAAERAIRADPTLAEAYFNRALALEQLQLTEAARRAWEDARQRDPGSEWAAEAGRRAARKSGSTDASREDLIRAARTGEWDRIENVLAADAQLPREVIEDHLLADWAAAVLDGRFDAARDFGDAAYALAKQTDARHPDPLLRATVASVQSAGSSARKTRLLARAHREYADGRVALQQNRDTSAARHFSASANLLKEAGSPFREWAEFQRGLVAYYLRDIDQAREIARTLERTAAVNGYQPLFGRVQWLQGLLSVTEGNYANALSAYHRALAAFERHGDREHRAAVAYLLAEVHMNVGDRRNAWSRMTEALTLRADIRDPWRRHTLLLMAGVLASRHGFPEAALAFQTQLVDEARARGNPVAQTEAHLQRATTFASLRAGDAARADIDAAYALSGQVSDRAVRESLQADVMVADGEVRLAFGDPAAIGPLDQAIPRLRHERYASRLARLLLAHARANLLIGNAAAAEADLHEGITLVERMRAGLSPDGSRLRYGDRVWDLYEEMAAVQLRAGNPMQALELVDRSRARFVAESLNRRRRPEPQVLSVDRVKQLVVDDSVVLSYLILDSASGVWVVTRSNAEWVPLSAKAAVLRADVRAYVDALTGRDAIKTRDLARRLYDALLRPVDRQLEGARRLLVVPHDVLNQLPFGTLVDATRGEYVVERYSVLVAPSIAVLDALANHVKHPVSSPSVLAVGDPRTADTTLPRLSYARQEAEDVFRLYAQGAVLVDANASSASVMRRLPDHDILHFAGHAAASSEAPDLSRLLMAPSADREDGSIYVRELWQLGLAHLQLVVLSACRTADGPLLRGEGAVTLSSAFLGAGVPRVVGTLWDVPDHASAVMSVAFHKEFASGTAHDVALQHAQLFLLRHPESDLRDPAVWGAFQSFGVAPS